MPKKAKMDPQGRLKFLTIWILRLNNIVNYTMKFYRKTLATKAQHSSYIFGLMFKVENMVPNFLSSPISDETAVADDIYDINQLT